MLDSNTQERPEARSFGRLTTSKLQRQFLAMTEYNFGVLSSEAKKHALSVTTKKNLEKLLGVFDVDFSTILNTNNEIAAD